MSDKSTLALALACSLALAGCLARKDAAQPQPEPDKLGTVIVHATDATAGEKAAAEELKVYLGKITGGVYSLLPEGKPLGGAAAIHVGRTTFAKGAGLDFSKFSEEEYALKTVGKHLVIGGGRPNGTANGVNHFLTRELVSHFSLIFVLFPMA